MPPNIASTTAWPWNAYVCEVDGCVIRLSFLLWRDLANKTNHLISKASPPSDLHVDQLCCLYAISVHCMSWMHNKGSVRLELRPWSLYDALRLISNWSKYIFSCLWVRYCISMTMCMALAYFPGLQLGGSLPLTHVFIKYNEYTCLLWWILSPHVRQTISKCEMICNKADISDLDIVNWKSQLGQLAISVVAL